MKSTSIVNSRQIAEILFDIGAVTFSRRAPFKFDSGILSPVYTDNRLIISYPDLREKIVDAFIKKVQEIGIPDIIAGTATAGIPHAAFIAQKLNIPMVYVRGKPKDHGRGNQVEGKVKRGQTAIVIEDLISTAGSSIGAVEALRKLGLKVNDVIAIFSYDLREADVNLKKAKVKLHTLTNLETAAHVAFEKGFLKKEQIAAILDWAKDPRTWGK